MVYETLYERKREGDEWNTKHSLAFL